MRHVYLITLAILICQLIFLCGAFVRSYEYTVNGPSNYKFHWSHNHTHISIGIAATDANGWIAIGFPFSGHSMPNSDIIMGYVDNTGNGHIYDYKSTNAYEKPPLDSKQDIAFVSASKQAGYLEVEFDRPLNTGDLADVVLDPCAMTNVIYAYHRTIAPSSPTDFQQHHVTGLGTVRLCQKCTPPSQMSAPRLITKETKWIQVEWDPPLEDGFAPITSYTLERDDGTGGPFVTIFTGTATTYNATELWGGVTYKFRVRATNCIGSSSPSPELSVTTDPDVPPPPTEPELVASYSDTITLSWNPDPRVSVVYCTVERHVGQSWIVVFNGTETKANITGLAEKTNNTFRVACGNEIGLSQFSSDITFATSAANAEVPGAPTITLVSRTLTSLELAWSVPNDGGSPILYYNLSMSITPSEANSFSTVFSGKAHNTNITDLSPGTTYSFIIIAVNTVGPGDPSNVTSFTTEGESEPIEEQSISTGSTTALNGDVTISWTLDVPKNHLTIRLECKCTGYVGFGIGPTMVAPSDMIIGSVTGSTVKIDDYWSTSRSTPRLDTALGGTNDIVSFSGYEENGITVIEFTRLIQSQDQYDLSIDPEGENDVMIAFHRTRDELAHHGSHRATLRINFASDAARTSDSNIGSMRGMILHRHNNLDKSITITLVAHGILMYLSWGLMLPFGVLFARYAKPLPDAMWFKVHQAIQLSGYIVSLAGAVIAFVMTTSHFTTTPHTQLGLTTMVLGFQQILFALIRPHAPAAGASKTLIRRLWEHIHRWLGRFSVAFAIAAIFSGLAFLEAHLALFILYAVQCGVLLVTVIVMEIRACMNPALLEPAK